MRYALDPEVAAALSLVRLGAVTNDQGSAVVYAHGGGMVLGSLDSYDTLLDWYVSASGVPFLSVPYRLAPESQGTALAEDVYFAIAWLRKHAGELGATGQYGQSYSAVPAVPPGYRRSPHPRGSRTPPAWRRRTSRRETWTSSATKTSPTRPSSPQAECR